MLSQSLCGTKKPDSTPTIPKVQIRDRNGEKQHLWSVVDGSASSIIIAPRLVNRLQIIHQEAHIATCSLNGGVMQHAQDSGRTWITVQ